MPYQALSALVRTHTKLAGEIEALETKPERMRAQVARMEAELAARLAAARAGTRAS